MSGGMRCGIGHCTEPPVGSIAVRELFPNLWSFETAPTAGVVVLCRRHFTTPAHTWDDPGPSEPGAP